MNFENFRVTPIALRGMRYISDLLSSVVQSHTQNLAQGVGGNLGGGTLPVPNYQRKELSNCGFAVE